MARPCPHPRGAAARSRDHRAAHRSDGRTRRRPHPLTRHPQVAPECELDAAGNPYPSTAATTGLDSVRRVPAPSVRDRGREWAGGPPRPRPSGRHRRRRRPPAPVSTATERLSSPSKARKASRSWSAQTLSTAFRRSGRLIVMTVTGPSCSSEQRVGPVGRVAPPQTTCLLRGGGTDAGFSHGGAGCPHMVVRLCSQARVPFLS